MKQLYSSIKKEFIFFINNPKITFLLLFWMSIFFSINTRPDEIYFFGIDWARSINALRILIPLCLTYLTTIYLIFFFIKNNEKNYFKKTKNLVFLFYAYYLLQTLGLAFNVERDFNHNNFFLVILCLGVLNIFLFFKIYKFEKYSHLFLKTSIMVLIISIMVIIYLKKDTIIHEMSFYSLYTLTRPHELFLYGELPRATGISRSISMINLFFMVYLFQIKNIKFKIITYIPIIIISFTIWSLQSRGTIICYYTAVFVLLVLIEKTIKEKVVHLILILVFPVFLFNFITSPSNLIGLESKKYDLDDNEIIMLDKKQVQVIENKLNYFYRQDHTLKSKVGEMNNEQKIEILIKLVEDRPISRFERKGLNSSGRVEMWKYALVNYDKKKIFGYGPQGDRILLVSFLDKYSTNISNAVMHAFLNAGYFSLIVFMIIYLKLIKIVYSLLISKKINLIQKNKSFMISFIFILFFSIRAMIENSFTVFSIDFLLFIISLFIIDETYKKKFNKN